MRGWNVLSSYLNIDTKPILIPSAVTPIPGPGAPIARRLPFPERLRDSPGWVGGGGVYKPNYSSSRTANDGKLNQLCGG